MCPVLPHILTLVAPRAWPEAVGSSPETCDLFVSSETLGPLAPSGVSWSWGRARADGSCSVLNMLSPTQEKNAVLQPGPGTEPLAPTLVLWLSPKLELVEVAGLSSGAQGGALGFDREQVSRPPKGWGSALDRCLCDSLTQCGRAAVTPRQWICGQRWRGEIGHSGKGLKGRVEGRTLSLFPSREASTPEVPVLLFPCEILSVLRGAGREMQGLLASSSDRLAALSTVSEMSMWGHQSLGDVSPT